MAPSESAENAQAMPMSKTKPPSMTIQASRPEERAFGRQLSTNNGEATGQMHMLAVAPETKDNFNVSVTNIHDNLLYQASYLSLLLNEFSF